MGIETWPVVEDSQFVEAVNLDDFVEWKRLTDCVNEMDDVAKHLNVTPLGDFYNYCLNDALNDGHLMKRKRCKKKPF